MIKLKTEMPDFCEEDCQYFEAIHDRIYGRSVRYDNVIRCKHAGACRNIAKRLKKAGETKDDEKGTVSTVLPQQRN